MSESGDASAEHVVHGVRVCAVRALDGRGEGGEGGWDAVVVVVAPQVALPAALREAIESATQLDAALDKECAVLRCAAAAGARLVLSPTGPLTPYHDVRSIYEAWRAGVQRALRAGARRPLLALQGHPRWPRSELVALLGALEPLYVPLQIREDYPERVQQPLALGVCGCSLRAPLLALLRDAAALELGRGVARDVGGADPERMAPPAAAQYLLQAFPEGGAVRARVERDPAQLARRYPLLAAVSRAADAVPRHRGCVVFLEYSPPGATRTVMLVGKGVTYDTGGCDVKAGGAMAGMSRDKCGAAAIAGLFKACELLKPTIRVVAALGLVRNSIGEEAYVADELVRSRSGLAVRVGNTDAEGRMVMADLLAEMRELAAGEKDPHIYTVATLTGHAHRAVGEGYSVLLDNHAAQALGHAQKFRAQAEQLSDMVEVSTLRREDLAAHAPRAPGDQLHQADNLPSTQIARGHQGPAAFLLLVSGLDSGALPYSHLDVAASAGSFPAPPTAAPLLALAAHLGLITSC